MKPIPLIVTLLCFLSTSSFAQKKTDSNIIGHIINKNTREHIPFHTVAIKGTMLGVASDASGHYFIKNLPEGQLTIVASGVGYKTVERIIESKSGTTLEVNFEIEEDVLQLNSVVVSANRNEVNRKESASIVNLISPKLFESTNSVCLAQGLNFQPGLRVENNCQNCGFSQVRINGLDGSYSQILIDSRPVFSSLAGIYGLEQIPANMIERVEVIRGGGSALYGSSAIAGIVNIITKEPTANSVTLSNTTNLIYGRGTDFNTSLNASIVSEDYKAGLMFFGSTRQRSPFDYDNDGFTELTKINMKNLGFRAYYKPGLQSKLSIEYHNIGEFRRGGSDLDLPAHESLIAEQLDHNINTGGLKYEVFSKNLKHRFNVYSSVQLIDRKSYYGTQKNLNAYGMTSNTTFVTGTQYTRSIDSLFMMPSELTAGVEYNSDIIKDEMPGYNRILNQDIQTIGVFAQNEWKTSEMSILLGGRLDKHSLLKKPVVSPRINLRYMPMSFINLRASLSSGFRAPQSFDEDLHITILGGEASFVKLDPNLETERSQSFSASAELYKKYNSVETNLLIEGFYTNLYNVFVIEDLGIDENGNMVFEKRNGSGAIVKGINIEGQVVPSYDLQFQFGVTLQNSSYKKPEKWSDDITIKPQKRMFRAPNQYGYLTANYNVKSNFKISLSGTFTGKMLVQHFAGYIAKDAEKETDIFLDVNVKISYDFEISSTTKLQFNGGIQNIFNSYQKDIDKGPFRDAGYIYGPSLPRTYFIGLKLVI